MLFQLMSARNTNIHGCFDFMKVQLYDARVQVHDARV